AGLFGFRACKGGDEKGWREPGDFHGRRRRDAMATPSSAKQISADDLPGATNAHPLPLDLSGVPASDARASGLPASPATAGAPPPPGWGGASPPPPAGG